MKNLIIGLCIALSLLIPASGVAAATENYTPPHSDVNSTKAARPSEIEMLYPMTPSAEAAIVHVIPGCPVIIDGVMYEAKDIRLFDGQRLRFSVDRAGALYAFTSPEGLEKFIEAEYGITFGLVSVNGLEASLFYPDWWYGGVPLPVEPGTHLSYLGEYDNAISSAWIWHTAGVYLFEFANFGGSYFYMPPDSTWTMLSLQGWNDRASSIWAQ